MITLSVKKAKNHLHQVLKRLARGEAVTVDRVDVAVGPCGTPKDQHNKPTLEAIAALRAFRQQHSLAGSSLAEMIKDGRG